MRLFDLQNGIELRSQSEKGKGHLHAVIGGEMDGTIVEQSKDHGQLIQRVILPDGRLVITHFMVDGETAKELSETTVHLWKSSVAYPTVL